jgi:hypothetical protein
MQHPLPTTRLRVTLQRPRALSSDRAGASFVEYIAAVAVIGLAGLAAFTHFGETVSQKYADQAGCVAALSGDCAGGADDADGPVTGSSAGKGTPAGFAVNIPGGGTTWITNAPDGSLVDSNGIRYVGAFDGKDVKFVSERGGDVLTGKWVPSHRRVSGIMGVGPLSRFTFTFLDHGGNQHLNSVWTYAGTTAEVETALVKAGYVRWRIGTATGSLEYRLPSDDMNSAHFIIYPGGVNLGGRYLETTGNAHFGEFYPGAHPLGHVWYDIVKPSLRSR